MSYHQLIPSFHNARNPNYRIPLPTQNPGSRLYYQQLSLSPGPSFRRDLPLPHVRPFSVIPRPSYRDEEVLPPPAFYNEVSIVSPI